MAMAGTDTELVGEDMADTVTEGMEGMDLTTVVTDMVMAGEAMEVMEDTAWVAAMEDTGHLTDTQDTHTMDMEVMVATVAMVVTVATDMEATGAMDMADTADMDHIITSTMALAGDTTAVLSDTTAGFLSDTEVLSKSSGDPQTFCPETSMIKASI